MKYIIIDLKQNSIFLSCNFHNINTNFSVAFQPGRKLMALYNNEKI